MAIRSLGEYKGVDIVADASDQAGIQRQMREIDARAGNASMATSNVNANVTNPTTPRNPATNPIDATKIGQSRLNLPQAQTNARSTRAGDRIGMTVGTTPVTPATPAQQPFDVSSIFTSQDPESQGQINDLLQAAFSLSSPNRDALEQASFGSLSNILNLQNQRKEKQSRTRELQLEGGIPELRSELESIRSEADVVKAQINSKVQAISRQTEGVSKGFMSGRLEEVQRQGNLDLANLAIRELSATGRINATTALIESKLDLEFGDIESEIELAKSQLEAITPFLSREDARVAEQRSFLLSQASSQINAQREDARMLEQSKAQLVFNMQRNGASSFQIKAVQDAKTLAQANQAAGNLGVSVGELLQEQAARESIATSRANRNAALLKLREEGIKEDDAAEVKAEAALSTKSVISNLKTMKGASAALGFGFKKSVLDAIPFVSGDAVKGSARADFEAEANRLADMFLVQNLDKMTGVLTDKDLEVLRNEGTTIGNFNQSEKAWFKELERLEKMMERGIKEFGITPEQASFYYGVEEDDLSEINSIYGASNASGSRASFNPGSFY